MEIKIRFTEPRRRQRMALMITREPHCFEKILGAIKSGGLKKADAAVVLSNRRDLEPRARENHLPFVHIPWEDRMRAEQPALRVLGEHAIDLMVLAWRGWGW